MPKIDKGKKKEPIGNTIVSKVFFLLLFLQDLHKKYSYIRKTRPDGNCFYRAFGFSHLESLLDDGKELQK